MIIYFITINIIFIITIIVTVALLLSLLLLLVLPKLFIPFYFILLLFLSACVMCTCLHVLSFIFIASILLTNCFFLIVVYIIIFIIIFILFLPTHWGKIRRMNSSSMVSKIFFCDLVWVADIFFYRYQMTSFNYDAKEAKDVPLSWRFHLSDCQIVSSL